jgi:Tfp pilus assembly protein PilO
MSAPHRAPLAASIFVIAGVALVPVYPYIFFVRPDINEQHAAAETQVRELDTKVEQARSAQRKYTQFREELARLDSETEKLRGLLPEEDHLGRQAETAAAKHELTLLGIEPLAPVDRDLYRELPHDVALHGSLEPIAAFLRDFDMPTPFATITRIELKRDGEQWRATPRIVSFTVK